MTAIAVGQTDKLPAAWQKKTFENAFSRQRTIPRVDRGYLVSFQRRIFEGGPGNLYMRSLSTGEEQPITFWIKGASEIRAEDVAVGGRDQIYVAGSLTRPGEVTMTNFVAEVDRLGNPLRVFDLGPFTPKRLCSANDGTFWVFGLGLGREGDDGRGDRLLRQYSADGVLLHAYLPNGKFPAFSRYGFRRAAVTLTCGDESVGVYMAHPARWIEVDPMKSTAYKWRIENAPAGRITGAVLMGSHEVYATFATSTKGPDGKPVLSSSMYKLNLPVGQGPPQFQSSSSVISTGVMDGLFAGGRPKGSWALLKAGEEENAGKVFLLGRDGQSLVYVGRRLEGADPSLYWVHPEIHEADVQ